VLQIIALTLAIAFPQIVLWLPISTGFLDWRRLTNESLLCFTLEVAKSFHFVQLLRPHWLQLPEASRRSRL
jgi:hypothetical protein